jgi:hypothetical protein
MTFLSWLRTHLKPLSALAGAVSHADLGPYAGAPRNPDLRIGDEKSYSVVHHITITTRPGSNST